MTCVLQSPQGVMGFTENTVRKTDDYPRQLIEVTQDYTGIEARNYKGLVDYVRFNRINGLDTWEIGGGCVWNLNDVVVHKK